MRRIARIWALFIIFPWLLWFSFEQPGTFRTGPLRKKTDLNTKREFRVELNEKGIIPSEEVLNGFEEAARLQRAGSYNEAEAKYQAVAQLLQFETGINNVLDNFTTLDSNLKWAQQQLPKVKKPK